MSGNEWQNKNVLRLCLKTASDGADVTQGGRSFHVLPWKLQKLAYQPLKDKLPVLADDEKQTSET